GDAAIGGDITAGAGATGTISINAKNGAAVGGSITRIAGTLTANTVALTASGAGKGIGATGGANNVLTAATTVNATADSGGVFITETDGASFTATAAGAGNIA